MEFLQFNSLGQWDLQKSDEGKPANYQKYQKLVAAHGPNHFAYDVSSDSITAVSDHAKGLLGQGKPAATQPVKPAEPDNTPTINYSRKPPPDAKPPVIDYGGAPGATPTRTPGETEAGFKVPKEKMKPLKAPGFASKLAEQRRFKAPDK